MDWNQAIISEELARNFMIHRGLLILLFIILVPVQTNSGKSLSWPMNWLQRVTIKSILGQKFIFFFFFIVHAVPAGVVILRDQGWQRVMVDPAGHLSTTGELKPVDFCFLACYCYGGHTGAGGQWVLSVYDRSPGMAVSQPAGLKCQSREPQWNGIRCAQGVVNGGRYYYEVFSFPTNHVHPKPSPMAQAKKRLTNRWGSNEVQATKHIPSVTLNSKEKSEYGMRV